MQKIDTASALYPVSVVFEPPFHIFTHLAGHGERQSGWDVSSALTTHGSWQPSVQPSRRPSLADALVGALGIAPNAAFIGAQGTGVGGVVEGAWQLVGCSWRGAAWQLKLQVGA